eukprot:NODE_269_length_11261_cov_0.600359.p4 type:complete len:329 gc:universal NODE_269_length_11261_cov_0.600359:5251-6237(+)
MLQNLPKVTRDYYESGADNEQTLAHNINYFKSISLIPRLFPSKSSSYTTIYGHPIRFIGIAPFASQCTIHPNGEIETAKAAQQMDAVMILSTYSTTKLETVKQHCKYLWLQLYIFQDEQMTLDLIKRAELCGVEALVITVDRPLLGKRRTNLTNRYHLPNHLKYANFNTSIASSSDRQGLQITTSNDMPKIDLTWSFIKQLKSITNLKIILKGTLHPNDIDLCIQYQIDAIYISNHGGRQLDDTPHALQILQLLKHQNCQIPILVDGGFHNGQDVFKAYQLGAHMVFLGRCVAYELENGHSRIIRKMNEIVDEYEYCQAYCDIKRSKL